MSVSGDVLWRMPDPPIVRGPLRVLPCTDGTLIIYDARRTLAQRTVAKAPNVKAIAVRFEELAAELGPDP